MTLTDKDKRYIRENGTARLALLEKYFLYYYKNRAQLTEEEKEKLKAYQEKLASDMANDLERYFNDKI